MLSYPLFQYAYYVEDVRRSCEEWHTLYGAGPFVVTDHHKTERFSFRGTDIEADVSYAFGYLGDVMIQFIQQHDDQPSIYRDMYQAGESGFHHVAYLVDDSQWDSAKARLEGMGFECACELYANRVNAAYFDTRRVTGGFTEIHGDPAHVVSAFANWRHRHVIKTESDGAIMERPAIS